MSWSSVHATRLLTSQAARKSEAMPKVLLLLGANRLSISRIFSPPVGLALCYRLDPMLHIMIHEQYQTLASELACICSF